MNVNSIPFNFRKLQMSLLLSFPPRLYPRMARKIAAALGMSQEMRMR
jgi:hypothetical protein